MSKCAKEPAADILAFSDASVRKSDALLIVGVYGLLRIPYAAVQYFLSGRFYTISSVDMSIFLFLLLTVLRARNGRLFPRRDSSVCLRMIDGERLALCGDNWQCDAPTLEEVRAVEILRLPNSQSAWLHFLLRDGSAMRLYSATDADEVCSQLRKLVPTCTERTATRWEILKTSPWIYNGITLLVSIALVAALRQLL